MTARTVSALVSAVAIGVAAAAGWGLLPPKEGAALPQRYTETLRCRCYCEGPTGSSENTYTSPAVTNCNQYYGRTCNRTNTAGGTETGALSLCTTIRDIRPTYRAATPPANPPDAASKAPDASRVQPK